MFNVKCACGYNTKNFKFNIGNFYVDDCCVKAGYDNLGQRPKPETPDTEIPDETLNPDETKEVEYAEVDQILQSSKETREEKKARKKAEQEARNAVKAQS